MRANRLLFIALLLTIAAFSYSALAEIHFGGNEYSKVYIGGQEISKAQIAGNEFFAKAPSGPTHTFSITVGGRGSTRGYNAIAGWGSLATGSTATYTANGKSLTVIHARRLNNDFVFGLSGAAAVAADFPSRIVATKTTGTTFTATMVPKNPDQIRTISGGIRRDYDVQAGGDIQGTFANNQTVRIDLYY